MNIEKDIQRQFYNVYKGLIGVSEFEEWVYKTPEIENVYGVEFYFNLLDLNYKSRFRKNDLEKVIATKIQLGEFEQIRVVSLLEKIIYEEDDLVDVLEQIYDDYCRGYSFLRYLGLNYAAGIGELDSLRQKGKWDNKIFDSKRVMVSNIKPKMVLEARRLISFFQIGQLSITVENKYNDFRTEEDRIELNNIEEMFND
ncbi:hypothetical protein [Lysinibacillus sp. SGAir0095]|uniref:hypothetical protein n=1 Tax=Lysinibacillus sp. SGAir0095 TaxID=2070463 RepID=UPI0010CCF45E|nr:hypothetical protein [Lysinibacillus sp. SGAir0095]QCR31931.1 hypothetical protein C1N55_06960 [Lysinibacillus sp. SGAir0095]